ncbi:MAG: PstS family phosphate ABC transporter substrate-binding protein [Elusimicrobiota bacterium]
MLKIKKGDNMLKKVLLLVLIGAMGILGCGRNDTSKQSQNETKTGIQIKGSDTMVNLVQVWAEEFAKLNTVVNIGVTGGGSGIGFAALLNGTCDIAVASRAIEDKEVELAKEKNIKPVEFIVGLDGLSVIVHPDNPISKLTMDEVRDIFIGNVKNWKDVGGVNKPIVILSRESNSGTHVFFKEHILRRNNKKGTEEFPPSALHMASSQAIVDEVMQNSNAIGYVGMGYLSNHLKAIAIAKDEKSKYIEPKIENVMNMAYPISRPLYLYTNGGPSGAIKDFIDFALSDEGQKIVRKVDFAPIKKVN